MRPLESDEDEPELLGDYQKDLRQRANESIQQLSSALEQLNPDVGDFEGDEAPDRDFFPMMTEQDEPAWSQKTQSEAVNRLKSLLLKQGREIPAPVSTKPSPSKVPNDLVPMIHNQSQYIQHLEAEVKLCREELQDMKTRVRVVVVENEKLQSQNTSKALEESLKDHTMHNTMVDERTAANSHLTSTIGHGRLHRAEHATLKNELGQLKTIHQAQVESLEAQVISLRKDLIVSEKECEEAKVRLRENEKHVAHLLRADGVPRVAGLCLKCAQHEAVLAGTHTNLHVQAIDRITKERDELLGALRSARASQQEAKEREWSACLQVKKAVEMAEEANLQKAGVEVRFEQLYREVARQREQLEREARALLERVSEAREEGRAEGRKRKDELVLSVSSLSQHVAELELQQDRARRDIVSLTNQLEDTLHTLSSQAQDNTKVCVELQYKVSQAQLRKEEAERNLRELQTSTGRQMQKSAQEVERLCSELVGCRQHLEVVQKDGSQWQAKALSLAEQLANAQRQLHLTSSCPAHPSRVQFKPAHQLHRTRQERESAERAQEEKMASAILSAQEKERNLSALLQQTEAQHQHRVGELDDLLSSQNSLIRKLKEECCTLGASLEDRTENSRSELEQVALEKRHLEETVGSLRSRCSGLEDQCVQHGRMHQRMKDRLQQLDRHCQSSAQQVCELLAKQNQLMQERTRLTEEMRNLRTELPQARRVDTLSA